MPPAEAALLEALVSGATALGVTLNSAQQQQLLNYLQLLVKWNKAYNLTAITVPEEMITHHLLDSLAVLPYVSDKQNVRLLDVGSGAGLPGLVLAIAKPDLHCTLLDSNGKKTRFLTQAKIELKLSNVEVVQARVESYKTTQPFDCIISRAVGTLAELVAQTRHLLASGGLWLAMKGARPEAELAALPAGVHANIHRLQVPGLKAERHLIEMH